MLRNNYSSHRSQVTGHKVQLRPAACNLRRVACGIVFLFLIIQFSFAESEYKYNAQGKRDPFIPLVTQDGRFLKLEAEEQNSSLALEGIIYDPSGYSYAIVNGTVVKIGDKIADYEVLKIEKNKVVLIKEGQVYGVELKKEEE